MIEGFGKFFKLLFLTNNCIIFIGGLIVLSLGIWTFTIKSFVERLLGTDQYIVSASILILIGIIIVIISIVGSLGAYKEIRCMLITYFVILVMIFLVVLAAVFLIYLFRNEMDERMQTEMFNSIKLYGLDFKVTQSWDLVQTNFNCCGVVLINSNENSSKSYLSWLSNSKFQFASFNETTKSVPWSCCKNKTLSDTFENKIDCQLKYPETIYQDDCYIKLKNYVCQHSIILAFIALVVSILIFLSVILSFTIFYLIK